MGKKLGFVKEVGNFSTSKRPKISAFQNFSKKVFEDHIFVNLRKRLESDVLAGQCKFSMKAIIYSAFFKGGCVCVGGGDKMTVPERN